MKSNFNLDTLSVLVNELIQVDEEARKILRKQKALREAVDFMTANYKQTDTKTE